MTTSPLHIGLRAALVFSVSLLAQSPRPQPAAAAKETAAKTSVPAKVVPGKAASANRATVKPGQAALPGPPSSTALGLPEALPPADLSASPSNAESSLLTAVPLKITLTPSETPLKLGSTSNIAVDILNVSNRPVEVDTTSVQLMTHAILSETDTLCVLPLTPTTNTTIGALLVLQPQDHMNVLFNLSQRRLDYSAEEQEVVDSYFRSVAPAAIQPEQDPNGVKTKYQRAIRNSYMRSCDPNLFGPIKRALDFSPGSYEYYLTGKFSVCDPTVAGLCPIPERSFAQSAAFAVGIDQTQIIIFAIVGGLLAYLVVAVRSLEGPLNHLWSLIMSEPGLTSFAKVVSKEGMLLVFRVARDLVGVGILSAAFTIVSSRLSDTQFPIKIAVLDAWGAITIGFLSYFAGNKFIDSLRRLVK